MTDNDAPSRHHRHHHLLQTTVCLMTKQSAGVGINLTSANVAIIVEPSMDAHDEMQSICRIHRIGQTRPVAVYKFFTRGTIEERILKRRQERGELTGGVNTITGGGEGDEEGGGEKSTEGKSKGKGKAGDSGAGKAGDSGAGGISASRTITFTDLKLIFGI